MVDYSPSAKKYSFQKRFNVSQGTSPMTIRTLFKKFQCTSSNEQVGSDGLKRIVIITKNFATVSEIVKKKKKIGENPFAELKLSLKCSSIQ